MENSKTNEFDDEIVPGSEGEDSTESFPRHFTCLGVGEQSHSAENIVLQPGAATTVNPGTDTVTHPKSDSAVPKVSAVRPRPRPRPIYRGPEPSTSAIAHLQSDKPPDDVMDDVFPLSYTSAIAERAKMRWRAAKVASKPISTLSDSGPHDQLSKSREKRASTSNRRSVSSKVIEISSDEDGLDELALVSSSSIKATSKRRADSSSTQESHVSKRGKTSDGSGRHGPDPSVTVLAHTRSFRASSPLPPSDPPSSLALTSEELDHPPIAILPNAPDSDMDLGPDATRLPSSPPVARIRKRRKIGVIHPVLENDPDHGAAAGPDDVSVLAMRAPPPFFASSSQSEPGQDKTAPTSSDASLPHQGDKGPKSSKAKGKRKVVDDAGWNEKSEAEPKPKAKRKKDVKPKAKKLDQKNKPIRDADVDPPRSENNHFPTQTDILVPPSVDISRLTDDPKTSAGEKNVSRAKKHHTSSRFLSEDEDADAERKQNSEIRNATLLADIVGKGKAREVTSADSGIDHLDKSVKENVYPDAPTPSTTLRTDASSMRSKSTPMSELIRRVNSLPGSPFAPSPSLSRSRTAVTSGTAYSPYAKSSRSVLARIAPLHPNRRPPPPPLPKPPPPKKTKKQLALEEKWEEELSETVEGWACLPDEERSALKKAKIAREMGWEGD